MKNYTKEELAVILIDFYNGLEYKHKWAILSLYQRADELFINPQKAFDYVQKNLGNSALVTVKNSLFGKEYEAFVLKKLKTRSITAITYLSEAYPSIFKNLPSFPLVIYAKGNISLLNAKNTLGIVGSRKTLPFVLRAGEEIAREMANSGTVIVSGSAVGGDRSALIGALDSGNVISILASGHDHVSPQSNRDLVQKIASNGLVISEYPPESPALSWHFPMRNRLISALSDAVLFLSGASDSGTKYTAKFAEAYSKRLYAIPYSIGERSGEICNMLIKMGKAQLIETALDLATVEGVELTVYNLPDLDEEELYILSAMDGTTHVDIIAMKTGRKAFEITPVLSMMEIKGVVARNSNNTYTPLVKLKK